MSVATISARSRASDVDRTPIVAHHPEPDIDIEALEELARLGEHHQAPGTILGVSANSVLVLHKILGQLCNLGDQLAIIASTAATASAPSGAGDPAPTSSSGVAELGEARPAAAAVTGADRARLWVSAAIDKASIDAIGSAVSTALAEAFQTPFAEVQKKLAETNAELFKLQTQHGIEQRRVIDLHQTNETLIREMRELRMAQLAAAEGYSGLSAQYQGTVRQLRELHNVVADMGVGLHKLEETVDVTEQLIEVVEDEVAQVAARLPREGEPNAPPTPPENKPPQKKR